jgi:hypothetical protein
LIVSKSLCILSIISSSSTTLKPTAKPNSSISPAPPRLLTRPRLSFPPYARLAQRPKERLSTVLIGRRA